MERVSSAAEAREKVLNALRAPLEEYEEDLLSVVPEHYDEKRLSRQNGIGLGAEDAQ